MLQPELGIKVSELRKQKNMTQEELAARCNLNVRSIQRIEKGEAEPRGYTLNLLSNVLEFNFGEIKKMTEKEKKLWLVFLHLSNLKPIVIIPFLIWVFKKESIPELDKHAKDVINFQISMCIYLFSSAILAIILIGILFLIVLGIFITVISILNAIKVFQDKPYYYPFTLKFIS